MLKAGDHPLVDPAQYQPDYGHDLGVEQSCAELQSEESYSGVPAAGAREEDQQVQQTLLYFLAKV